MIRTLILTFFIATTALAAPPTPPNARATAPTSTEAATAPTSTAGTSSRPERLETLVQRVLPDPLQQIHPGKTTRAQIEKLLGKPLSDSQGATQYFAISIKGTRTNDLTISYDPDDKVRYIFYRLPSSPAEKEFPLSAFRPLIPKPALKKAHQKMRAEITQHEAGRTFDIPIEEKALSLQFTNSQDPTLSAVLLWKPGERMP